MDAHPYLGGFHSLLSRAYHIRGPTSMDNIITPSVSTLPQRHPLLVRYTDRPTASNDPNCSLHGNRQTTSNATTDIQRSNIVQQLLTNISTTVGAEEILSFSLANSPNQRQTNGTFNYM